MKKILPRLALLAAPFLVYFALFFAFEPYDYFGVKGGASSEDCPDLGPVLMVLGALCKGQHTVCFQSTSGFI